MYSYVDHGLVSISTKFQTNTPNNKEVSVGRGPIRSPPGQRSAKNSRAWIGLRVNLLSQKFSQNKEYLYLLFKLKF